MMNMTTSSSYQIGELTYEQIEKTIKILKRSKPLEVFKFLEVNILSSEIAGETCIIIPMGQYEYKKGDKIFCVVVRE